ncbi:MAG: exonuclease SbcCD subunit D [Prevotella sp.]|nr:exonuclease SbcCD subunit D [Prevotella sp.]
MKILHTSDWHLGHTLYNYDRTEEQLAMMLQIRNIIQEEQPDAFLLCGDVYHTATPSAAIQTMFTNAIVSFHEACPTMTIIITAGNHDSGSKHEIFRTPWRILNVYMIGSVSNDEGWENEHIIKVKDKGYIIALPYQHERNMPKGIFQTLLDETTKRNTRQLPVVMMAHTTVGGADFIGHDHSNERSVGGIDCLDLHDLGDGYDYLALGHIHHAQFIQGSEHRVRYSGSPLAVSFDETYSHSISIVEIASHGKLPQVRTIDINNPHPLVTLPTDGWTDWETAQQLLKGYPDDIPAYIRLNVEVDDFLPASAQLDAAHIAENKDCRFCHINARRTLDAQKGENHIMTVAEFQAENPIDIARRYAQDQGIAFDADMEKLFNETLSEINK